MDGKGFFLGLIAAVVLFLLWKREIGTTTPATATQPSNGFGGCSGCAGAAAGASPTASASPAVQASVVTSGTEGFVSPGTPPLQTVSGTGSFYNATGPTPDNTFLAQPAPAQVLRSTSDIVKVGVLTYNNVPGSATTPANQVPVRAVQQVAPTSLLGFQQRYSFVGIPRTAGARSYVA
jgi:hypothetical protein